MSQNENEQSPCPEGTEKKADSQVLAKVGGVADHIVGDLVLGSVGRMGRHLNDIPGVGHTGRYIGANIADGYRAEDLAIRTRKLVKEFVEKGREGKLAIPSDTLRGALLKEGVSEEHLDAIMAQANKKAFGSKESEAEEAGPAAPAAVPA